MMDQPSRPAAALKVLLLTQESDVCGCSDDHLNADPTMTPHPNMTLT